MLHNDAAIKISHHGGLFNAAVHTTLVNTRAVPLLAARPPAINF